EDTCRAVLGSIRPLGNVEYADIFGPPQHHHGVAGDAAPAGQHHLLLFSSRLPRCGGARGPYDRRRHLSRRQLVSLTPSRGAGAAGRQLCQSHLLPELPLRSAKGPQEAGLSRTRAGEPHARGQRICLMASRRVPGSPG
ncbi:unnamed protein product, partial [Symbiodinium microadriaticum]